jgi:hypothetical protein
MIAHADPRDATRPCRPCAIGRIDALDNIDFSNPQQVFEADARIETYGPSAAPGVSPHSVTALTDDELARFLRGLRDAVRLPLNRDFLHGLATVSGFAEAEARKRIAEARKRKARVMRYGVSSWEDADLLAEVSAVAGAGRQRGGQWWFNCPFGHSRGRTPSLHVDPERRIWKCFGCQRGGGVVGWRRSVTA